MPPAGRPRSRRVDRGSRSLRGVAGWVNDSGESTAGAATAGRPTATIAQLIATGPPVSRSPSRFVAWLGLSLLVAWLMFGGGGWAGIYSTELRTASVVLIAITLAVWAVAALRNPAW